MSNPTGELKIAKQVEWICPKGHISKGWPQAFTVTALSSGENAGNICPVCYVEWIAANIPTVVAHE